MNKKKLIVFDIGNVLLRFSKVRAKNNFDRIEPGSGAILVHAMWETRLGVRLERGELTGRDFFRKAGRFKMSYQNFADAFRDIFTPLRANMRLLERLSEKFDTALLSNTSDIHWPYLFKTYPTLKLARWKFGSHRLKRMKPDLRVYRILSSTTGYDFGDIVYVDDHPGFVEASKRLGIQGICFTGTVPLKKLLAKKGIHP
jgi:FMN phosphatase YigB (HAD superfamily)